MEGSKCKQVRHRESLDCENRYNLDVKACSCIEDGPDNFPEDTIAVEEDSNQQETTASEDDGGLDAVKETTGPIDEEMGISASETTEIGDGGSENTDVTKNEEKTTIMDVDANDDTVELNSLLDTAEVSNTESKDIEDDNEVVDETEEGGIEGYNIVTPPTDVSEVDVKETTQVDEGESRGAAEYQKEDSELDTETTVDGGEDSNEALPVDGKEENGSGSDNDDDDGSSSEEPSGDGGVEEIDELFGDGEDYSDNGDEGSTPGSGSGSGI